MVKHHEPFSHLGPVEWAEVPHDNLKEYLDTVFSAAQTVVESVPSPSPPTGGSKPAETSGRPRSQTDSAVGPGATAAATTASSDIRRQSASAVEQSQKLRGEWKEVKINARENPLDIKVHKLSAKDGKGTWFARRSIHEGLSYDQWRNGLAEELLETLKIQGQPGGGSIRGIGADRLVEKVDAPGAGQAKVFHLSAQFPGPTSPRDFVTLLLTSDTPKAASEDTQVLRQFMVVSKPCIHPDCGPRQGFIRGQYESVEVIRELAPATSIASRSLSSTDLPDTIDENRVAPSLNSAPSDGRPAGDTPTTIEWLMVTRSDPGGSVPRFMIEKGTPPGIVNDAGKFVKWVTSKSKPEEAQESAPSQEETRQDSNANNKPATDSSQPPPYAEQPPVRSTGVAAPGHTEDDEDSSNGGLWGMVTGAFWGASSVVSAGLGLPFGTSNTGQSDNGVEQDEAEEIRGQPADSASRFKEDEDEADSDTSSIESFASALSGSLTDEEASVDAQLNPDSKSGENSSQLRELKKLEDRRRKLDEKAARLTQRRESKLKEDKEKESAMTAKAREKHEKEMAKQEAKYKREMQKLEEKRAHEERKAEQRRKKAADREGKANITMELEKTKAERDYARKQVEILSAQVGELQSQNTMLTAKLGRLNGLDTSDSASVSSKNTQGGQSINAQAS